MNNLEKHFLSAILLTEILDQPLGSSLPGLYSDLFHVHIMVSLHAPLNKICKLYSGSDIQETEDHAIMGFENGIN